MSVNNQESIISFTSAAIAHIQQTLSHYDVQHYFRLTVVKTGCNGYQYSPQIIPKINEDDVAVNCNSELTVFIDKNCIKLITGTEVDYVTKSLGQKILVFNNPQAVSECGCGESFNVEDDQ